MNIVKQNVGIDISKKDFAVCICKRFSDPNKDPLISEIKKFDNSKTGFNQFLKWVAKNIDKNIPVYYTMEATGVYHEPLANHLHKLKKSVAILLPNTVNHFAKSLNRKSKTDEIDAVTIALMGCERKLLSWSPPKPLFKKLRSFCRLHQAIKGDKARIINRLKNLQCSHEPIREAIKMNESNIKKMDGQLKELEKKMIELLKSDPDIWKKVENLETIIGVGLKTIAVVLGETQGFELIENQRQLTSFCGYDIVRKQSGTSVNGQERISKKGNSNVRAAMFFPAISAIIHNPTMKTINDRIMKTRTAKRIGQVAIQRRLLVLMYSLWKKNEPFVLNYKDNQISDDQEKDAPSSSSTHRVENMSEMQIVDELVLSPSTQNEHLHDQS